MNYQETQTNQTENQMNIDHIPARERNTPYKRATRNKNKSAQVRKLMREQPNLTPKQIAGIVGCKPHTVHNVKYLLKKKKRLSKIVVVSPTQTMQSKPKTPGLNVRLSFIKTAIANLMLDAIISGNTDLVKNKHFQTLVKLTTTSENDQP